MRGVELPINILVLVVLAVIVLLGLIALFFVGWSPFPNTIGLEGVKNSACAEMVRRDCAVVSSTILTPNFDADRDGNIDTGPMWDWTSSICENKNAPTHENDNLASLCFCYYNRDSEARCKALCGCPTAMA